MSEQPPDSIIVTGGTGITAGHDAIIGDISGELAIKSYIENYATKIVIKGFSREALIELMTFLEQKRQEASNLEILERYNPSALPYYPLPLKEFVTTNRVEELNKALMYLQDHRILLFTGIGGVGKTTLARALIDIRPANVSSPFWFDFRQNESAKVGDILEKLAAYMNSPDIANFRKEKREAEKKDIDRLTGKLQSGNPVWLIFDNLETILDNVCFQDEDMDLFFTCLRNSTHKARIIITSRTFPKLKDGECLIDVIEGEKQNIRGLKTNFAIDYLAKSGLGDLEPDKLKELAIGVDGHPLALKLLVDLVKEFGVKDTLEDLSMYQEEKENTILKARKLFEKLVGDEKGLLERISVYREPVEMKGLKKMFTETTSHNAIKKLIDKSLLETDHKGNYWLHPLVREFAYDDLKTKIETHRFAMEYYLSLPIPEKPAKKEDIQFLIEAHHHACMAKEYDQAFKIIFDNSLDKHLDYWGNYTVLIDLYSKLLPQNHFGKDILLGDKGKHSLVLRSLGLAYRDLGDPRRAIEYYEQTLKIDKELLNWQGEGADLENLGNAYRNLGETRKAIQYYEQALKINKEITDRSGEGNVLGNLGIAYSDLSDPRKAIEYYEQALKICQEIGDKRGEGRWLGSLGNACHNLGDPRKAIEYYEQALKIAEGLMDRRGEGNALGNLGVVYRNLGDPRKAIEYYEQALKICQEIGYKLGEGIDLGNIGLAYSDLGDPKKAIEYYEQALKIAKEIGNKHSEGIQLENLGNAYRDLSEPRKAIEYCGQALKIATIIENRRGEGNALRCLGVAYRDLNYPKKAIEYYEQALSIGKEIEDLGIINFCEKSLEELKYSKK